MCKKSNWAKLDFLSALDPQEHRMTELGGCLSILVWPGLFLLYATYLLYSLISGPKTVVTYELRNSLESSFRVALKCTAAECFVRANYGSQENRKLQSGA